MPQARYAEGTIDFDGGPEIELAKISLINEDGRGRLTLLVDGGAPVQIVTTTDSAGRLVRWIGGLSRDIVDSVRMDYDDPE